MRIQRIPPTERKGRIHTSTVTVAVTDTKNTSKFEINESDIKIQWYSGSGNGGQARNKVQNCCRLIHVPTGIIKTAQFRDRASSYNNAYKSLSDELKKIYDSNLNNTQNSIRQKQIGSGMRGDKVRTFRFQDNSVTDHRTNKTASCKEVMKGNFHLLW